MEPTSGKQPPAASGVTPPDVASPFAHPNGWAGWVAGQLMALKDRARGRWVLSLLTVRATDAVLEVGFGPGTDLRRMSARVPRGFVAGVDASPIMLRQATRRNALAIRAGRMRLIQVAMPGPLPFADATFDLAYSINSYLFWADRAASLAEIRRVLKPGGRIALAVQPMWRGANVATAHQTGQTLGEALIHAGFREVRVELRALHPTPVACALGTRAGETAPEE